MTNWQAASVEDVFERALGEILARVSASERRIAVAYSGGLDSAALLHLVSSYASAHALELYAFHIHHGLSANADAWLAHCEHECAALGVRFDVRRVTVSETERHGVEQAARTSRYSALGELCRQHDVPLLLTAHHQDDQAETVLLQLLRGAGVAGLSGMAAAGEAPELFGSVTPVLGRPLLNVTRAELAELVRRAGIRHIEDESNADTRYSRNALRHCVAAALGEYFPGYQKRVARAAEHAQSAQRLLDELAAMDCQSCVEGGTVVLERLKELGDDRQLNVLRYWFGKHRVRMPTTSWLSEMREQLLYAREDARVRVVHPECEVRRHRGKAYLIPRVETADAGPCLFRWQGEASIRFPKFGGTLCFDWDGDDAGDWLRGQPLEIRHRQGGEKLKLAEDRPTRSLKHHYQALDIPSWERERLPVVLAAGCLIFAAGIGMNWSGLPENTGRAVRLHWEKDIN